MEIKHIIDLLCKEKAQSAHSRRVKLERAAADKEPGVQERAMTTAVCRAAWEGNRW